MDLHNLSKTCRIMRCIVETVHQESYADLLRPYAAASLTDFEHTIVHSGAVIIGSAALSLIVRPTWCKPNDLNLAVPRGATEQLHCWLLNNDFYSTPQIQLIDPSMEHFVNSHHTFYNRTQPHLKISVTESLDDTILTVVVLAGKYSSEMVYVTPGGIFCAHPRLTLNHIVFDHNDAKLRGPEVAKVQKCVGMGMLYLQSTLGWDSACSQNCPTLWHGVDDTKQRLLINWTNKRDETYNLARGASWHTHGQHHYWRLGNACHNKRCMFRLRDPDIPKHSPADYKDVLRAKIDLAGNPVRVEIVHNIYPCAKT